MTIANKAIIESNSRTYLRTIWSQSLDLIHQIRLQRLSFKDFFLFQALNIV